MCYAKRNYIGIIGVSRYQPEPYTSSEKVDPLACVFEA